MTRIQMIFTDFYFLNSIFGFGSRSFGEGWGFRNQICNSPLKQPEDLELGNGAIFDSFDL